MGRKRSKKKGEKPFETRKASHIAGDARVEKEGEDEKENGNLMSRKKVREMRRERGKVFYSLGKTRLLGRRREEGAIELLEKGAEVSEKRSLLVESEREERGEWNPSLARKDEFAVQKNREFKTEIWRERKERFRSWVAKNNGSE